MELDYKNFISHIDIDRSLDAVEFFSFKGLDEDLMSDFKEDIFSGNDSIELHLVKSKSYKEALILKLKKSPVINAQYWKELLKEEQKTFGGSKIFYIDDKCLKLLVLSVSHEIKNKLNMVVTRLNKVNEKITRLNAKIKKDNLDLYASKVKIKENPHKNKEEIIYFINQNLKV
jgi:cell division protein FtsL